MSDLFARMVDRAAGRSPVVRATAPHVVPAFAPITEHDALPAISDAEPASAAASTPIASPTSRTVERLVPPAAERREPPLSPVRAAEVEPPVRAAEPERMARRAAVDPLAQPSEPLSTSPLVAAEPVQPATPPLPRPPSPVPMSVASERPLVPPADDTPAATRLVTVTAATPSLAESALSAAPSEEPITPPRPRVMRAATMLPKLDLRQALDAVGRALAEPPRPRPAPARPAVEADGDEVHVTIGHIDVRAATPVPAAPAQPSRRGPSITLADYLRRRPGSPR